VVPAPSKPGLGIELDRAALRKFREAAQRISSSLMGVASNRI